MRTLARPFLTVALGAGLVACGGGAKAPAVGNTTVAGPRVERVTVPCPTGDELTTVARAAWANPTGDVSATCVALFAGGQALWYLDGAVEREDPENGFVVDMDMAVVAAATRTTLWSDLNTDQPSGMLDKLMSDGTTAIDLDGDGNDELVDVTGWGHGGYENMSLMVWRVDDGHLTTAGTLPVLDDNRAAVEDEAEAVSCSAERSFVDAPGGGKRLVLVGTWDGSPSPDACPAKGRHVYSWTGKDFVEVDD